MYRIIIADDHAVVCTGLELILKQTMDLRLADQVRNGDELLEKMRVNEYDIVILDISMPGKDALDVLKEIKNEKPGLPVVIFTMNPDVSFAGRMFSNGASAYINKETRPEQIVRILRKVAHGQIYKTNQQSEIIDDYNSRKKNGRQSECEQLTDREYQVLHLLVQGVKKSEIAQSLSVSKNTVGNHRNNIMKKLSVKSNSELIRYAIQKGIIN